MAKPVYFYGIHAIMALLTHRPTDALSLFVQSGKPDDKSINDIIQLAHTFGVSVQTAQKSSLTDLCGSPQHQGVVLHARPLAYAPEHDLAHHSKQENCLFLVLDQITDAHNLGACLRTAVAMGVTAVICPKNHTAPLTPTVAKVSVGAAELIPVMAVTNLARCLNELKNAGVFVYGTALNSSAQAVDTPDYRQKIAIVMGSEADGMRRLTADSCDQVVYIPMASIPMAHDKDAPNGQSPTHQIEKPKIESLNISVATGMILYEVSRQRRLTKLTKTNA